MNKYYLVRKDQSLKYERFVLADTQSAAEEEWGNDYIIRADAPPEFIPPYCPYLRNNDWVILKGPQTHYSVQASDVENPASRLMINEDSVYEIQGTPQNVYLSLPTAYLKETSVFFTFSDSENHAVSVISSTGETIHLVGTTDYWVSGKSYILTIYNNYVIIGVSQNNV